MVETVVTIGVIVLVAISAWIIYESYYSEEGEGDDMAKQQPVRHDEHDQVREMQSRLRTIEGHMQSSILQQWRMTRHLLILDAKADHLIEHSHHLEALIVAAGHTSADQAKIDLISAKLEASRKKMTEALKANTPKGDTPQS